MTFEDRYPNRRVLTMGEMREKIYQARKRRIEEAHLTFRERYPHLPGRMLTREEMDERKLQAGLKRLREARDRWEAGYR